MVTRRPGPSSGDAKGELPWNSGSQDSHAVPGDCERHRPLQQGDVRSVGEQIQQQDLLPASVVQGALPDSEEGGAQGQREHGVGSADDRILRGQKD